MKIKFIEIEGYEDYLIYNNGSVFSKKRNMFLSKDRINGNGYNIVSLYGKNGSKVKEIAVHQLVGMYFVPGYVEGYVLNHKDGNKLNNSATNLEWVSYSKNTEEAYRLGLINGVQKSIYCYDNEIDVLYKFDKVYECANFIGSHSSHLSTGVDRYKQYTFSKDINNIRKLTKFIVIIDNIEHIVLEGFTVKFRKDMNLPTGIIDTFAKANKEGEAYYKKLNIKIIKKTLTEINKDDIINV